MAFHERVVQRINGWGILLRFITPLGVGLLIAQFNMSRNEQINFRREIKSSIERVNTMLTVHLHTEVPDLRERIRALEVKL
jgi:hypothetical protein